MNSKREKAFAIVELFEDFLEEKGIDIPCEDPAEEAQRRLQANSAKLYGTKYWAIVEQVEELL